MDATLPPHLLAAESRSTLLAALRAAEHPLSVSDAAAVLGLHASTARFHLGLLVSAGLVERETERRGTAGRPRIRYRACQAATRTAVAEGAMGTGSGEGAARTMPAEAPRSAAQPAPGDEADYRRLAGVLVAQLSELDDPSGAARDAGRRWVEALDAVHARGTRPIDGAGDRTRGDAGVRGDGTGTGNSVGAMHTVAGLMQRLGFEPDVAGPDTLTLRRCPFESVAREHRAVVCGVHAGMLERTLEGSGSRARLEPFAEDDPLVCVVRLSPEVENAVAGGGLGASPGPGASSRGPRAAARPPRAARRAR